MKKIFLTINLSSKDLSFDDLQLFEKIDIGELISSEISKTKSLNIDKFKMICEYAVSTNNNIVFGFAIKNSNDYLKLKKLFISENEQIAKVYYKNENRSDDYENEYKVHSNWMDYKPKYIKEKNDEYDQQLDSLFQLLKTDNVDLVII